jgi:cyclopropane-fatty-acyl-phospholipid synthase
MTLLSSLVAKYLKEGALLIRLPDGKEISVGAMGADDTPVVIRITDWRSVRRIANHPHLALGECFMDGTLQMERGAVYDLLDVCVRNFRYHHKYRAWSPLTDAIARWRAQNGRKAARHNVAHHYDLSYELYRRFLDADMQYSCAYFPFEGATIEEAQENKKRHIAEKLLLGPGMSVLDIGCGWGGLGLTLAGRGASVTGVTLSEEQLKIAQKRAAQTDASADFRLQDYRDVTGPFDRIVSVGMLEHVGRGNFQQYFDTVARLLRDDGVALIHTIVKADGPAPTSGWTAKYIFPGGYIPALSQLAPAIERAGLIIADIESLRIHYANTLRAWRERFEANRDDIRALYDDRFCRMWEFYLAGSEASFRVGASMVMQFQLAKRLDTVPIKRDYLYTGQAAHAPRDLAEAS